MPKKVLYKNLKESWEVKNMDNITAIGAIVGIINGAKLYQEQDKSSFVYFCLAVGVGVVFGAVGLFGLTIETGLLAALASSGLYKVAQVVGGK